MNCTELQTIEEYFRGVITGKALLTSGILLIVSILALIYMIILIAEFLSKRKEND